MVWTLIDHGKLASQIARLAAIVVKSCFDGGCSTSEEELTQQCRKLLWIMVVHGSLIEVQGVSA